MHDIKSAVPSIEGALGGLAEKLGMGFGLWKLWDMFMGAAEAAHAFEKAQEKLKLVMDIGGKSLGFNTQMLEGWIQKISEGTVTSSTQLREAATQMLMFGNIQGTVFQRALQTANDMSQILGSVGSAAMMLGRALQDPTRGSMMLRRAGIILTQAQKDEIKALQQANNLMGAQSKLLDIINEKRHGLAAAYAKTAPGQEEMLEKELSKVKRGMGDAGMSLKMLVTGFQIHLYSGILVVGQAIKNIGGDLGRLNDATGGWLGKLTGIIVIGPLVYATIMKVWTGVIALKAAFLGMARAMLFSWWTPVILGIALIGYTMMKAHAENISYAESFGKIAAEAIGARNAIILLEQSKKRQGGMSDAVKMAEEGFKEGNQLQVDEAIKKLQEQKTNLADRYQQQLALITKSESLKERIKDPSLALRYNSIRLEAQTMKGELGTLDSNLRRIQGQRDVAVKSGALKPHVGPSADVKDVLGVRSAFPDLGKKIQDMITKRSVEDKLDTANNLADRGNKLMEQVVKNTGGAPEGAVAQ